MLRQLFSLVILVSPLLGQEEGSPCSKDEWRCSDGACIWSENKCNGKLDCRDGSDESQANCQKIGGAKGNCIIPPKPERGQYRLNVDGKPGDAHHYLNLILSCDSGYKLKGVESVHCYNGWWPEPIAKCVYAGGCGVVSDDSTDSGQTPTKRQQMPWHVDFYDKMLNHRHICAGSLIREDTVISVNYCFFITYPWPKPVNVDEIVAVAGNRNYAWNGPNESALSQKNGVRQIYLANYDPNNGASVKLDEIAVVILTQLFVYNAFVRPICVDFDMEFQRRQLQPNRTGMFAAWGFSRTDQKTFSPSFDVIDFTFVDSETCMLETQGATQGNNVTPYPDHRVCTIYKGDLYHCLGGYDDTGTGLVYSEQETLGLRRFYLRGVLWRLGTEVVSEDACAPIDGYALFTKIMNFEKFITKYFKPDTIDTSIKCILPPYPAKGTYIANVPNVKPGHAFDEITINVTCQEAHAPSGPTKISCDGGKWSSDLPQCVPLCRLPPSPSVEYRCLVSLEWMDGFRACEEFEPSDTLVSPICRTHYYSATSLKFMHCIEGEWFNSPKCTPECGTLTPNGTQLVIGGKIAQAGEVPWHAGIYSKTTNPYKQICGGSIISNKVVISAAHCFWDNLSGKLPESRFAVAVGKLYRRWDSTLDESQKFDVKGLHLPIRFQGSSANFQDDIAVIVLSGIIKYETYIRPVCVDFDINFERRQLQPRNKGKVAGWGLTAENDNLGSQMLRVVDLPYVTIETCIKDSPASFRAHITSDKICAGYNNAGTALCKGDSGGGLAFLELDKGTPRYYLRGVASTAPTNDNLCNANTYTSFTRLITHEHLVNRFWGD